MLWSDVIVPSEQSGSVKSELHTLVIPTYNRPELLSRLVGFYREERPAMNLLVLDSSRPEIVERNRALFPARTNELRHEVFPTTTGPSAKFAAGVELVRTPYLSFCADDDIVFPDAIDRAVTLLQQSPEYASAHGLYLNFRVDDANVHLAREYGTRGLESESPVSRVFQLCQRYESLFYGVLRTQQARAVFSEMARLSSVHFQELFQSVATVLLGKVARIPVIYAGRRSGPQADPALERWQTQQWFADAPGEVISEYRNYRDALLAFARGNRGFDVIDEAELARTLDLSHAVYFSAGCSPQYLHASLGNLHADAAFESRGFMDRRVEASRLLTLRDALWPAQDLLPDGFDELRTGDRVRRLVGGLGGFQFAWHTLRGIWSLANLNRAMAGNAGRSHVCVLPSTLRWIAGTGEFREKYRVLCRYLDRND